MTSHEFKTPEDCGCKEAYCYLCEGSLQWCKVCNGAEGELTTHCPGHRLESEVLSNVMAGVLDYVEGEWKDKSEGLTLSYLQDKGYISKGSIPEKGRAMDIQSLKFERLEEGTLVTVGAFFARNEEIEEADIVRLFDSFKELSGGSDEPEPEKEPEPSRPRRARGEAAATPEKEPEAAEEKPARRRRAAAEPEAEKPAADDDAPRRRRRTAAEPEAPKGPSADDVAKAASACAEKRGPKVAAEIIGEFSTSGKLDGIPADKRQAFIEEINFELEGDEK